MRTASYVTSTDTVYDGRIRPRSGIRAVSAVLALLFAVMSMFLATGPGGASALLDGVLCGSDLGANTRYQSVTPGGVLASGDSSGNKYSIQDLYSDTIKYTTFNGSSDPSKIGGGDGSSFAGVDGSKDVSARAKNVSGAAGEVHEGFACVTRFMAGGMSNMMLGIASLNARLISLFVSKATNPDIICKSADDTGACINLLAAIGGKTGSDGGLIGRMYTGLYQGLIVLAFVAVGVWMLYTGLIKRKYSTAFSGLAWSILLFAIGIIAMVNPMMTAKAPLAVGTSAASCVIEGLNGVNCFNPTSASATDVNASAGTECAIGIPANASLDEQLSITSREASCSIWKAFVLEPWTVGQFGTSYANLYTGGLGSTQASFVAGLKTPKDMDYWKSITTSMYSKDGKGDDFCSDDNSPSRYSNIALYQLDLMTSYHDCSGTGGIAYHDATSIPGDSRTFADWYYVVDAMFQAKSTAGTNEKDSSYMWEQWYGGNSFARFNTSLVAVIGTILAAIVLISTAVLALVYMFTGIFLMAFASLFLLIGVVPGRGKKIFLGWFEQVASAVLKYFATILWVLVGVQMYGAVLGGASNMGMTLIFIVVVSMVIWMYRKEFINMMSRVNMGGQQMSNKLGEKMKSMGRGAADYGKARVGGAVGGFVGGTDDMDSYSGNIGDRARTLGHNIRQRTAAGHDRAGWAGMQKLKQGNNIIGSAAKSFDQVKDGRRRVATKQADDVAQTIHTAQDTLRSELVGNKVGMDKTALGSAYADVSRFRADSAAEQLHDTAPHVANAATASRALADHDRAAGSWDSMISSAAASGAGVTLSSGASVPSATLKRYTDYEAANKKIADDAAGLITLSASDKAAQQAIRASNKGDHNLIAADKAKVVNDWDKANLAGYGLSGVTDYTSLVGAKDDADRHIDEIHATYEKKTKMANQMEALKKLETAGKVAEMNASSQNAHGTNGKVSRTTRASLAGNEAITAEFLHRGADGKVSVDLDAVKASKDLDYTSHTSGRRLNRENLRDDAHGRSSSPF